MKQTTGFRAFIPEPLPPDPPIAIEAEMIALLSAADLALGRLDGAAQILPDPDLFVAMYVRREAVLSSQIEGTQSSLDDVLQFELDPKAGGLPQDVGEVVNYVRAMNYGLDRLASLPLSLRLIREIHGELLLNVRGAEKTPGEFRRSQNWIGSANTPLENATFVPPPVPEMHAALDNLERFLHGYDELPVLIHCGLAHAQFETIHPFLDGNGRVGRLLVTFLLCQRAVLHRPLLYLSLFLKERRNEYYDRLMAVRINGDWEGWLRFFVQGVATTAGEATETARRIITLRETHRRVVEEAGLGMNGPRLLAALYRSPIQHVKSVGEQLEVTPKTAGRLITAFERLSLLDEVTGGKRNRVFRFSPYLELFADTPSHSVDEA